MLAVVASVAVLASCGGPRPVSLTELARDADHYDGRDVVAHGVVMEFGLDEGAPERHFVLQDAAVNRVQLLPNAVAEEHVGETVEVLGEFEFDPNRGRLLHIEAIEDLGPTS